MHLLLLFINSLPDHTVVGSRERSEDPGSYAGWSQRRPLLSPCPPSSYDFLPCFPFLTLTDLGCRWGDVKQQETKQTNHILQYIRSIVAELMHAHSGKNNHLY